MSYSDTCSSSGSSSSSIRGQHLSSISSSSTRGSPANKATPTAAHRNRSDAFCGCAAWMEPPPTLKDGLRSSSWALAAAVWPWQQQSTAACLVAQAQVPIVTVSARLRSRAS
jgi:hypothetical protein